MKRHVKELITRDWLVKILLAALTWFATTTWNDVRNSRDRLITLETKIDILMAKDDGRMMDYNILKTVPKVVP